MKPQEKVLLYGGTGLLGTRIIELLGKTYKITAPTRQEVDLEDNIKIKKNLETVLPDYIVYAAGITKQDFAEENPDITYQINSEVPGYISEQAARFDVPLVYFSTDAVFDGTKSESPYIESDITNPISVYGKSKLQGENLVLAASNKNCVLRVIMLYSANFEKKKDLPRIVIDVLSRGEEIAGIRDQTINPTFVDDAVSSLGNILLSRSQGIYHLGATDYLSNYEFAIAVADMFKLDAALIKPALLDEFYASKSAKRTKHCWLSSEKFRNEFGEGILHSNNESIAIFKKQIKN